MISQNNLLFFLCHLYSIVTPAVTFQVRPNAQNITTTDVANVAG